MWENKKKFVGKVVKISGEKTISVSVERTVKDNLYNKKLNKSSKFLVHDEKQICRVGDRVGFQECRPLSKKKHFFVIEVLNCLYDSTRV